MPSDPKLTPEVRDALLGSSWGHVIGPLLDERDAQARRIEELEEALRARRPMADLASDAEEYWTCTVGPARRSELPTPADPQMRGAVRAAFDRMLGRGPEIMFSGWGSALSPGQQMVLDNIRAQDEQEAPDA